jgi:DNA-binding NarL/FixJ family response regulator
MRGGPRVQKASRLTSKGHTANEVAGKRVLIVDDNEVIRKILTVAFLSDGFEACAEAPNGKEGIKVAQRIQPDLIILDLSMPVMNGLEAAPLLRKLFPQSSIFLFSLYADGVLKENASKAGIDLVISKNEPLDTIVKKAHELMNG